MSTTLASPPIMPADPAAAGARAAALTQMLAQLAGSPATLSQSGISPSFASTLAAATGGSAAAASTATPASTGVGAAALSSPLGATDPTAGASSYAATAATAGATQPSADATGSSQYDGLINQAAARYGLDPALLHGLIQQESGFNPNAVSSAGAMGLTQLMPENATALGVTNPYDPAQSIDAGAHLLSQNLATFKGNVVDALAAYNAGPSAVSRFGGVPPYPETQNYVTSVMADAQSYRESSGAAGAAATAGATPSVAGVTQDSGDVLPTDTASLLAAAGDPSASPSSSSVAEVLANANVTGASNALLTGDDDSSSTDPTDTTTEASLS